MDPDFHGHVCEHCGTKFSHRKSLILKGEAAHGAHECPQCGRPVNVRVEEAEVKAWVGPVFKEWYGPGDKALDVSQRAPARAADLPAKKKPAKKPAKGGKLFQ